MPCYPLVTGIVSVIRFDTGGSVCYPLSENKYNPAEKRK